MKSLAILASLFFVVSAFSAELPLYPDCYRGTMKSSDGKLVDVFVSFRSVEKSLVRVQALQIGNYSHSYSGTLNSDNSVTFNSNDDYIPGGNASYNIDIKLDFNSGKTATGSYKEYRFQDGYGGYGQSDSRTLYSSGEMTLKKCRVKIVDQ